MTDRAEKVCQSVEECVGRITRFFVTEHGTSINIKIRMVTDEISSYQVEAEGAIIPKETE